MTELSVQLSERSYSIFRHQAEQELVERVLKFPHRSCHRHIDTTVAELYAQSFVEQLREELNTALFTMRPGEVYKNGYSPLDSGRPFSLVSIAKHQ